MQSWIQLTIWENLNIVSGDYEKDLAPKHTRNGERVNDPLPVYLSVEILNFDKISTLDMMFG